MNVPLPFQIDKKYVVYGIENSFRSDELVDMANETIRNIFILITNENQRIYALDWHHSAFLYDPRNIEEQKSFWVENKSGKYFADFPSFIPDGDYYFFIEENFEFGYLGHPWREEVWIWGDALINKVEEVYQSLGWKKIV